MLFLRLQIVNFDTFKIAAASREESLVFLEISNNISLLEKDYLKLVKKYQNKYKDKELERKVIESLLLKGYNYKSVKEYIGGMPHD